MAMGSFNRKRQYKQQNPMANAATMLGLLKQQNDSLGQVGDAVELQGQNQGRQKVAELMGTDEYSKLNPEQAQAAVLKATGGRRLGERGDNILKTSYDTKDDVLKNQQKMDAATLLNSRQMARDNANNTAEFGGENGIKPVNALLGIQDEVAKMTEEMNNPDTPEPMKKELQRGIDEAKIKAEYLVSGKKPSTGGQLNVMETIFPSIKAKNTKAAKDKKMTKLPKSLSMSFGNSSKGELDTLTEAYNQDLVKPLPREFYRKGDPKVENGQKQIGDAKYSEDALVKYDGKWIRKNREQIIQFLNQ